MNISLEVDTGKFKLEVEAARDLCPLCSQMEDHPHTVVLTAARDRDDLIDGGKLPREGRAHVMEMIKEYA